VHVSTTDEAPDQRALSRRLLGRAAVGAAVLYGFFRALVLVHPRGMGFGDVKLATVIGFVLGIFGWPTLLLGLLMPHLINGPVVVILLGKGRVARRSALPLGPALLTGALLAIALM